MKFKPNVTFSQNLKRTSHATPAALGIKEGDSIKVHLQLTMNSVISPERSIMFCVIFDKFLFFFFEYHSFNAKKKKKKPFKQQVFLLNLYICIYIYIKTAYNFMYNHTIM